MHVFMRHGRSGKRGGTRTPQKLVESIKRADHDGIGGYEFAFKYDEDGRLIGYSINYDGTFAAQSTISYEGNTVIRESCSMYNPETESWTAVGETSYLLDENGYLIKTETKDMAIDGTEDEPYITTMTFSYEDGRVCSFLKEEPDYEYAEYTEFVWENDDIVRGTYNATTTTDDGITHFHSTDYEYTDIEDKFNIYVLNSKGCIASTFFMNHIWGHMFIYWMMKDSSQDSPTQTTMSTP